jgi:hypothetical protein
MLRQLMEFHMRKISVPIRSHISDETMRDVKNAMDQNPKEWWIGHHHGFGMDIRNLFREGGFDWGPIEMDDLWIGLVERAVRKKFR